MKAKDVKRDGGKLKYRGHEFDGFNKPKKAPAGSKHKKMVLAKKGDDLKDVQSPHQLVEKMRALGQKAELKEHNAGTRQAVEVQVPSRNLHVMFVKAAQCGNSDTAGGKKAPKAKTP